MKLNVFQRWAILTTISTYFLIMVGGFVRAAGAGLGCPDWPSCFGRWIPPTDISQVPPEFHPDQFNITLAWIEYINRLIGVTIGIFILVTLILAIRHYRKTPRVLWPTVAAFLGVVYEGWLGKQVVAYELKPIVVTLHLVVALIIVSLLLYATVCAFFPQGKPIQNLPQSRKNLGRFAFVGTVILIIQIALGAWLRGELSLVETLHFNEPMFIDYLHRSLAVLVALYCFVMSYWALKKFKKLCYLIYTSYLLVFLVIVQIAAGMGLVQFSLPPYLQVIHLIVGSLLLGAFTTFILLCYRLPLDSIYEPVHKEN